MGSKVEGFIIESDQPREYYHRVGAWIPYSSPAQAYVWTKSQVSEIAAHVAANQKAWPQRPAFLHPAQYFPELGTTIITGAPIPFEGFPPAKKKSGSKSKSAVNNFGGRKFDLKLVQVKGIGSVIVSINSL